MSTRALTSDFQTAREYVESRIITNPLEGDPAHRVLTSRWFCDRTHWGPGRLNDPARILLRGHPDYPDLYCVRPDVIERQVDRLIFFTRTYASIPASFDTISSGIISTPGFDQAPTYASAQTITAVSTREYGSVFRLTKSSHGYSAGDNVHVQLTLQVPASVRAGLGAVGRTYAWQAWNQSATIRAVTTDTFDVALSPYTLSLPAYTATIVSGFVRKITSGFELRPITTRNLTTIIRRDYFLPGVSAGVPVASAIPLSQPFRIEQGTETDENFQDGVVTASTVPTATQFRAMIDANALLTLDCLIEDYLGPIVCRKTTLYPAL